MDVSLRGLLKKLMVGVDLIGYDRYAIDFCGG
jgi:hypothetical protein